MTWQASLSKLTHSKSAGIQLGYDYRGYDPFEDSNGHCSGHQPSKP